LLKSIKAKPESYSLLFLAMIAFHMFAEIFISTINTKIEIPLAPQLVLSELIILVPGLIFIVFHKSSFSDDLGFKRIRVSTALMSVLLIELLGPLISVVNLLSQLYAENAVVGISDGILEGNFFLMTFLMGIYGPFCEELVFRGIIAKGMGKYGSVLGSALMSGFMFGLMHLNFNQFCYAFVLGIVFAVVNSVTGSIWTSVIMHVVVNMQNVLLMYGISLIYGGDSGSLLSAAGEIRSGDMILYVLGIYIVLATIFTAISIPVFGFIARNEGNPDAYRNLRERVTDTKKWWLNVYSVIGVLVCLVIIFALDAILKALGYA